MRCRMTMNGPRFQSQFNINTATLQFNSFRFYVLVPSCKVSCQVVYRYRAPQLQQSPAGVGFLRFLGFVLTVDSCLRGLKYASTPIRTDNTYKHRLPHVLFCCSHCLRMLTHQHPMNCFSTARESQASQQQERSLGQSRESRRRSYHIFIYGSERKCLATDNFRVPAGTRFIEHQD